MFKTTIKLPETFFYNATSCWGWGTWKRAWKFYNPNTQELLNNIQKKNPEQFDRGRGFIAQLEANIKGKIKTWAIKWNASVYLQQGLCLHPSTSLTQNIGTDGTGTNYHANTVLSSHGKPPLATQKIQIKTIPLKEDSLSITALKDYQRHEKKPVQPRIHWENSPKFLASLLTQKYHHWIEESPSTRDIRLMWFQWKTKGLKRLLNLDNYDQIFYKEHLPLKSAYTALAQLLDRTFHPNSVADLGCGNGFLLEYFYNKKTSVLGTEYSEISLAFMNPELKKKVKIVDLSILHSVDKKYEMVISTEVGEHIPKNGSNVYVQNICQLARKNIIFSAAQPGQWGDGHINCQPKNFWINLFRKQGWYLDAEITQSVTLKMKENKDIKRQLCWLIPNTMVFIPK